MVVIVVSRLWLIDDVICSFVYFIFIIVCPIQLKSLMCLVVCHVKIMVVSTFIWGNKGYNGSFNVV